MKTTEPRANAVTPARTSNTWREIVQSGSEASDIDGFALEYLIDFQRDRARVAGEAR
ncbi:MULTISPECIES: hypothetical protein [unclassified Roseivivax]|uniref:hypothetical protein n=1 Tax=unclassified Roseivivax TaxID=2639302 RepID=UPI001562BABA|nr:MULTISPECIES: hypothetical protein [unclassified Roseivivax]